MNYARIKYNDIANGLGVRASLFVSGCNHHCKGCFNEIAWDFDYGTKFTQRTIDDILDSIDKPYIQGLSILGGEPLDPKNQYAVMDLIIQFRNRFRHQKDIWVYTGYKIEDVIMHKDIYHGIDVLVDGPFIESQKDITLKFRGSANQRVIDVPETIKTGEITLLME